MKITDEIAMLKNTHLMDWLKQGYDHCQRGSKDWCEGYLNSAHNYILALEAAVADVPEPEPAPVPTEGATMTPEQVGDVISQIDDACNDSALTSEMAAFLSERDQQTTQDERDLGERETSAFYLAKMVRRRCVIALTALAVPAPEAVNPKEQSIRKSGQIAIDELIDRMDGKHPGNDDLADYLGRIVDACVRAALSNAQGK